MSWGAPVPGTDERDAILMEIAGWCEEMDVLECRGVLARRKRDREDAVLRVTTSERVRARMADLIRARMKNKVGDPVDFLAAVQAGHVNKCVTGFTLREAIALADKKLLRVCVVTQIAGPWNNTVGGNTEYQISLTKRGEEFLAQAIEARLAKTTGSVEDESAAPERGAP